MKKIKLLISKLKFYLKMFILYDPRLSIIILNDLVFVVICSIFYPLYPSILSFPPGIFEGGYEVRYWGISFAQLYILTGILILIILNLFLWWLLNDIRNWQVKTSDPEGIKRIRTKCQNFPYLICIGQIILPSAFLILFDLTQIIIFFGTVSGGLLLISVTKIVGTFFSFSILFAIIVLVFSKRIFRQILINTYSGGEPEGIRITLRGKIFLQVLPIFILAILFTALVGYSKLIEEKGDLLFKIYKSQLTRKFEDLHRVTGIDQIKEQLKTIKLGTKGCSFIIAPDGKIFTSDGSGLSIWFVYYMNVLSASRNGQIFDDTRENQGAIIKIKGETGDWIIGIKYQVTSTEVAGFFLLSFFALLGVGIFVLFYLSKSLTDDISLVTENLSEIAAGAEVNLEKKIPITSNDEIGDLVVAFNEIQEREIQHIKDIEENQRVLLERERLATLGQMIGGIAHNLRSPIMSIAGALEALKDLVKEYNDSVDNDSVTKEDHHEIPAEMSGWIDSMKPYCSFMSDLISAVREQAVQLNPSTYDSFSLEELIKRIEI